MKIAILAAGTPKYFPFLITKPKCLYHFKGEVQLERVIKVASVFVEEKDIIVIGGYKSRLIRRYLRKTHPCIDYRTNKLYKKSAIFSLRKAVENVTDDVVFMLADENINPKNVAKICESKRKMAILCEDKYYYYCVGIMKLDKNSIRLLEDDCYLSMEYMKKVYCFAHNKTIFDGSFHISSGICLGYTTIDLVRRIGNISKIEDPVLYYHGQDIDFIPYDWRNEYVKDVDCFKDTDEYTNNKFLKFYYDCICEGIRKVGRKVKSFLKHKKQ